MIDYDIMCYAQLFTLYRKILPTHDLDLRK